MKIIYHPYDQSWIDRIRAGGMDDYGNAAEQILSDGEGNPCRCCLRDIAQDEKMLVLSACPFGQKQPYAETGPIFIHQKNCLPYKSERMPPVLAVRPEHLIKAYNKDQRIVAGTGQVVKTDKLQKACETLLTNANVAFVDVRSSVNNCFTTRITRDGESWL